MRSASDSPAWYPQVMCLGADKPLVLVALLNKLSLEGNQIVVFTCALLEPPSTYSLPVQSLHLPAFLPTDRPFLPPPPCFLACFSLNPSVLHGLPLSRSLPSQHPWRPRTVCG